MVRSLTERMRRSVGEGKGAQSLQRLEDKRQRMYLEREKVA